MKPLSGLEAASPFSYACSVCGKCCRAMRIVLNPYELKRLARHLGKSTRQVIDEHTDEGGTVLRFRDDGRCGFLDGNRCSVHPDRPLVCRLYPLGRLTTAAGGEWFVHIQRLPECAGEIGTSGTVGTFLASQGAQPYIDAAARYFELFNRMLALLVSRPMAWQPGDTAQQLALAADPELVADWQDVDSLVEAYCRQHQIAIPQGLEEQIRLHLAAISEWVGKFEARNS